MNEIAGNWGGHRVGSGAKTQKLVVKKGYVAEEVEMPPEPPVDLPADQVDFWNRYASFAIEKRTLTPNTVAAFRLLCELDAEKQAVKATIDKDGRTYIKVSVDGAGQEHQELKAHPLKTDYSKLAKAVETLLARFGLAPFGKAELPVQRKAAVNPWAEVAQK